MQGKSTVVHNDDAPTDAVAPEVPRLIADSAVYLIGWGHYRKTCASAQTFSQVTKSMRKVEQNRLTYEAWSRYANTDTTEKSRQFVGDGIVFLLLQVKQQLTLKALF